MSRIRRVMHATDFSKASRPAFAKAVELAKANRAALILIHTLTLTPPFLGGEFITPQVWDEIERDARAATQKQLDALIAKARKAGVRATSLIVLGSPYEQIVRAARAKKVDMLVIGTHGRTGLPRLVLGSVAGRVLATARCPVLSVHGR
jgi:nucleotide-binding universal stress UspA family protein